MLKTFDSSSLTIIPNSFASEKLKGPLQYLITVSIVSSTFDSPSSYLGTASSSMSNNPAYKGLFPNK